MEEGRTVTMNQQFDRKSAFVVGIWAAYALAFFPLYRWVGGPALSLSIVPVAATGLLVGMRAGLFAGLLAYPVNLGLMLLVPGAVMRETLLNPGGLLTSAVILLLGVGVGQLHDLRHQLMQQVAKGEQVEQALREERDFNSAILETATALVVVLDPQGRIVRFNPACERITGYSFDEVKGRRVWDLFLVPKEVEPVKAVFEELKTGKASNEYENYWANKDGRRRLIAWSNAPLLDDEGRVEFIIATGIDITERVEAEQLLRRRNLELAARNAVAQAVSASLELQDVLDQALSGTVGALGFAGGLVTLVDERTGKLVLSEHVGLPQSLVERLQTGGLEGTLCGLVYQEAKPLALEDLHEDAPVDVQGLLEMGLQSYAGVPIFHRERTLGTLCLFHITPRPITETDYDLLTAIGQQIGIAVENARLFRDVVREREVAQALLDTAETLSTTLRVDKLLERVMDELQRVVPYDAASINMVGRTDGARHEGSSDDGGFIWSIASRGPQHIPSKRCSLEELPLAQRVVRERSPVIASHTAGAEGQDGSWLGVPMVSKEQVVGVLMATSSHPNAYNESSARLARAFAHQVALAIENSRLYEETRARLRQVDLLYSVTVAFSSTLDIDQILPYAARSLCEVLHGSSAEIYRLDERARTITVTASYVALEVADRERASSPGQTYTLADLPVTAEAIEMLHPTQVQVDDPEAPARERADLETRGTWAELALPMVARGHLVGLARVWDCRGPRRFTRGEIALGQTMVHQAAIALENARLYEEIGERRMYLESVLAAAPDAIVTLDADHRIAEWNPGAERLFGYSPQEVIGQDIDPLVTDPNSYKEAVDLTLMAMDGASIPPIETVRYRKDGSPVDVIVAGSPVLTQEKLVGAVAVYTDITELKQAQEELRKLSQAVKYSSAAIIVTDRQGDIEYVNPKFVELTGYEPEEVVGRNPRILRSGEMEPGAHSQLWDTITAGREWRGEFHNRSKDGGYFWTSASISPIVDAQGEITHFVSVQGDITELKRAQEELREAKEAAEAANRAKSTFLANMSHELRTPLNAILGFAQLMDRSPTLSPEHKESVQIISRSGEHLLDLINDVLDMSKIEAGRITLDPVEFDLHRTLESVEAAIAVRAQRKGLQVHFDRAPDVPQFVRTDERKLRQVFFNLLANAVKFTQEGGVTLRVSTRTRESQDEQGEDESPSLPILLHIEVEDTGVGIAAGDMDSLFEPFAQTESGKRSQEGTGLGLPISQEFVTMMGGELTVSSQVGQGTTFRFDIEVELADPVDVTSAQPARRVVGLEPGQPEYRILVVDDRVENRLLVRQILEPVGFIVREAATGKEALELHESWQPHMIWMDMRMPVMDGYEATQRIKGTVQGQATAIIALTASAMEGDQSLTLSAGCDDYVLKPFHETDLFDKLAQHLGVRYIYQDEDRSTDQDDGQEEESLTREALAALPADWIAKLHDAVSRARSDLVLDLVTQIEQDHTSLARALTKLVDEFRFDTIIALIE
jgi:PAS domain S-box-containing protein